jgi:hypothetical protein
MATRQRRATDQLHACRFSSKVATAAARRIASRLARKPRTEQRGPESRPVGCRYCARLGLGRLQRLGRLLRLRRFRRGHRCRRGLRRDHRWCRRGLRRDHRRCRRGLRGLRRLLRGHRWCLRGFGGVTPKCLRGLRPGCDHGRRATRILRLTPRPMRNAGPGMTVASLLGPAAAILLRRRAGHRGGWVKRREPGRLGRLLRGIGSGTEREPGQLLRGIAAAGAGEQPNQDCQPANCERHNPRDPHGYQAGHPGLRRAVHDDLSLAAMSNFGGGGLLPRGGADGYPSRAVRAVTPHPRNAPRPELEG